MHGVWKSQKKSHFTLLSIKKCQFCEFLKKACGQTVLPDRLVLIRQKLVENAKNEK